MVTRAGLRGGGSKMLQFTVGGKKERPPFLGLVEGEAQVDRKKMYGENFSGEGKWTRESYNKRESRDQVCWGGARNAGT